MATRNRLHWHRGEHDRCMFGVTLAVSACVLCARVLANRPLDLDVQLFTDILADAMHRIATARAASLVFRQIVIDAFALQVRRQRLASDLAPLRLADQWQTGVGQCGPRIRVVFVAGLTGELLRLVEPPILAFLALPCVAL
ncbi:hypothetical protein QF001_000187 [Paraburkholderia youngii]